MSEQTSADIQPISSEAKPPKTPKVRKQRSGGGFLGWFNLLLILALAGVVAAGGWFGWQHHNVLVTQLSYFKQAHQQQQANEQQLQQTQKQLQTSITQQDKKLSALQEQNTYALEQISKMAGADRQDWLIAEAEYLLRLANQRLQLERDWGSALAMLQAADRVLVEAGSPQLGVVRAHIADEVLALREAPAVDRQGAALRIQSLQKALPQLAWLPEKTFASEAVAETQQSSTTTWYAQLWNKVASSLSSLIRIRERNISVDAPLSPQQQYYMQQNMYLMLEQAQLALLKEEQGLYEHSLQRVSEWVQSYLMFEDSKTQAVQQSLQELLQWQVAPERPDISGSLTSLQKLIEQNRRGALVGGDA